MQTDPIGYADSMNLYQYCGNNPVNWIDPLGLTWEETSAFFYLWVTGRGPDTLDFGPGSNQVRDMQSAAGVNAAREQFYQNNADNSANGHALRPLGPALQRFGPTAFLRAGTNPTQHFAGSYTVGITPNNDGTVTFEIENVTSMTSFTRYFKYLKNPIHPVDVFLKYSGAGLLRPFLSPKLKPLPSWERSTFGPFGNMTQHYTWTEKARTPPKTGKPIKK